MIARNDESGEERVVLEPASPGIMTEIAMHELVDWYNANLKQDPWPILVGVEFTFRFLAIIFSRTATDVWEERYS